MGGGGGGGGSQEEKEEGWFTITKHFGNSVIVHLREREEKEELVSKNRCLGFLGFGDLELSEGRIRSRKGKEQERKKKKTHFSST